MFTVKDCVSELTTTTGTGDFVLAARTGYVRFNDALAGGADLFVYEAHAVDASGVRTGVFETGIGQFYISGAEHRVRRVRKLSGSDFPTETPVNFAAGNKVVSMVVAAAQVGGLRIGPDQYGNGATLYVRADGSDSNSGLVDSAGGAFLTLGHAVSVALSFYIDAEVHVGAGTFGGAWGAGSGSVSIIGAGAASTTIDSVVAQAGQQISVSGCRITTASGTGLDSYGAGAELSAYDIDLGACSYAHVRASAGGVVGLSDYTVSGGGGAHLRAESFGRVLCDGAATLAANITLTDGWAVGDGIGYINYDGGSIALGGHTVTGKRYDIRAGSVCDTHGGGASFFPGSIAGTTASGGQYL